MAPKEIAPEPRPGKSNVRTLTDTTFVRDEVVEEGH